MKLSISSFYVAMNLWQLAAGGLFGGRKGHDWYQYDGCNCFGDNFVGTANRYKYYSKRLDYAFEWMGTCKDNRGSTRWPEYEYLCDDVEEPSTCRTIPDPSMYRCHAHQTDAIGYSINGHNISKKGSYVILDGKDTRVSPKGPKKGDWINENRGLECSDICQMAFSQNATTAAGLQPLCNHTYLVPGKNYGKELPFELTDVGAFRKLHAQHDPRSCESRHLSRLEEGSYSTD